MTTPKPETMSELQRLAEPFDAVVVTRKAWESVQARPAVASEGLRAALEAYVAWQYRMPGARRFTLTDLRAALAGDAGSSVGALDAPGTIPTTCHNHRLYNCWQCRPVVAIEAASEADRAAAYAERQGES